ncbi:hypothetical protein BD309DRAFT_910816 [Dichomitus squalens]|uniref:Uncharacterized protein n=1 Tax=Dichomitus squalens TaxID=114155 RepID=A0A4Q9QA87_9APHY|nr:uncharacterized protein DICSQDRAFT_154099 [Dichomitus squalens LYAD-421 SS1]EJF62848.1 hypothetical protein DICSQDRAFT_154099 [Dichomitus squalens LYAD-421 SS1]TBU49056.1 hypothetical protein BD309DRAFT_910816 [Dichomitus squalens]TBU64150.1 hypothetical protein BD310DRAFT_955143 [Dichomitus squalens]
MLTPFLGFRSLSSASGESSRRSRNRSSPRHNTVEALDLYELPPKTVAIDTLAAQYAATRA